jgi:hypothetical protein
MADSTLQTIISQIKQESEKMIKDELVTYPHRVKILQDEHNNKLEEIKMKTPDTKKITELYNLEKQYEPMFAKLEQLTKELKDAGTKWIPDYERDSDGGCNNFDTITWKIITEKNDDIEKKEKEIKTIENQVHELAIKNISIMPDTYSSLLQNFKYINLLRQPRSRLCPLCHIRPLWIHAGVGYDYSMAECDACKLYISD